MMKFELGRTVATRAVAERMNADSAFQEFVSASFRRYINGDWGDTCAEDCKSNDFAVENGERILAVYKNREGKGEPDTIWMITEWDRSVTTILFPEDY